MNGFLSMPIALALVFSPGLVGCGAGDTWTPDGGVGAPGSAPDETATPSGDSWTTGRIPEGAESGSQIGTTGEPENDEGYVEAGIEIWQGGHLDIAPDGGAQGMGELGMVLVDYEADEEVLVCLVTWPIHSVRSLGSCRNCDWAYEVQFGALTFVDGSGPGCREYDFDSSTVENIRHTYGAREGVLLSIEESDWEPIGEVGRIAGGARWEFEHFLEEDDDSPPTME